VRQRHTTEEKHALATDEKVRECEQDKDKQQRKSTHRLEMRRQRKVNKTVKDDRGKARTS
jgi:hypothetical protein